MKLIFLMGFLFAGSCINASAIDLWVIDGRCANGTEKQAQPNVEMHSVPSSPIACDAATIMTLDNGRTFVQFVKKQDNATMPPGFGGRQLKFTNGLYSLVIDRVHPKRSLVGKTITQIIADGSKLLIPAQGFCFFNETNFSKMTQFSCVSKSEDANATIIYKIDFKINSVVEKRNLNMNSMRDFLEGKNAARAYESWKRISCRTYIDFYSDKPQPTWPELVNNIGEGLSNVQGMNQTNMLDSLACECLGKDRSLGDAAASLTGARNAGLWPQIPIGGATADPAVHRWRAAFQRWISGSGSRPSLDGHLACDYRR